MPGAMLLLAEACCIAAIHGDPFGVAMPPDIWFGWHSPPLGAGLGTMCFLFPTISGAVAGSEATATKDRYTMAGGHEEEYRRNCESIFSPGDHPTSWEFANNKHASASRSMAPDMECRVGACTHAVGRKFKVSFSMRLVGLFAGFLAVRLPGLRRRVGNRVLARPRRPAAGRFSFCRSNRPPA